MNPGKYISLHEFSAPDSQQSHAIRGPGSVFLQSCKNGRFIPRITKETEFE